MSSNIWKEIKEELTAKEVVEHFLGPPQKISGSSYFWSSPFRKGDTDPSFSANDTYIKDFGGDFSGDIFEFVMEFKNVSKKESLEILKSDFNLEVKIETKTSNKRTKSKKVQLENDIPKIDLVEGKETPLVFNMFDTVNFKTKPTGRANRWYQKKNKRFKNVTIFIGRTKKKDECRFYFNSSRYKK